MLDDQPAMFVDEETREQLEHEQMLQRASRSGWVDLSESTGDLSPKRKRNDATDASPPRKKPRRESVTVPTDSSPPRKPSNDSSPPHNPSGDSSPPRKSSHD